VKKKICTFHQTIGDKVPWRLIGARSSIGARGRKKEDGIEGAREELRTGKGMVTGSFGVSGSKEAGGRIIGGPVGQGGNVAAVGSQGRRIRGAGTGELAGLRRRNRGREAADVKSCSAPMVVITKKRGFRRRKRIVAGRL